MGTFLAVQNETTHEQSAETRHTISHPAIGVSVLPGFSGFNI